MNVRKAYFDNAVAERSPGPAAYRHYNSYGKQLDSTRVTEPTMKFGTGVRPPLLDTGGDTPGAKYKYGNAFGVQVASKNRSAVPVQFGTSVRPPLLETGQDTPGAKYSSVPAHGKQIISTKATQPTVKFGTSVRPPLLDEGGDAPGAKYRSTRAHGRHVQSQKKSLPVWSFGKPPNTTKARVDMGNGNPGPGNYEVVSSVGRQQSSKLRSYPSAKFGTSTRPPLLDTGVGTPGPKYAWASSVGKQQMSKKRSNGGFTMGAR